MDNNQIQSNSIITKEVINQIIDDQVARRKITFESHYWFFHLYFSQYVKYPTANFHREMFEITEDASTKMAVIVAFRGSAKSTIMTMSYPLWAVLGKPQKKCVVILSQTQQQVKTHFLNIKRELEAYELLRMDLGPFQEESDEWGASSLVIPGLNAKIVAASSEQSIRGIRHGANRPDLIICDDVEDLTSTKTREGRDKTFGWFTGEIVPCGDKSTKIIVIGNLLHEDSLLMRLRGLIDEGRIDGINKSYPLVDSNENIMWPGMFNNIEEVEKYKKTIGDEKAWQREYMLKIIADEDQLIKPEWIQYYDELPGDTEDYQYTAFGVDLAISKNETADYTAMVGGKVYGHQESLKIYILPGIINARIDFPTTLKTIEDISNFILGNSWNNKIFIEDVAYQKSLIQMLRKHDINAEGVPTGGQDKRARMSLISHLICSGKVLFPRKSAEALINQLVYFGVEKHDDLSDALTILLTMIVKNDVGPITFYPDFPF